MSQTQTQTQEYPKINGLGELIDKLRGNGEIIPIVWAAEKGYLDLVKFLHVNGQMYNHWAIGRATQNGHLDVVNYLSNLK